MTYRSRPALPGAGTAALLVLPLVLIAVLLGPGGWALAVDRSDSMRPALRAGDLLLLRSAPLSGLQAGTIITFPDPLRPGRTLTHRLVARERAAGGVVVVETRGDANTASERWQAGPDQRVGTFVARVPHVGRGLAVLTHPLTRSVLVTALTLVLAYMVLHWIWRPAEDAA